MLIIMTMKACCELYSKFIYECVHRSTVGGQSAGCQYSCFNHTISHRTRLGTRVASSSFLITQSVSKLTTHIPCGKKRLQICKLRASQYFFFCVRCKVFSWNFNSNKNTLPSAIWLYFVTVLCEIKIKHCIYSLKQDLPMLPSDSDL